MQCIEQDTDPQWQGPIVELSRDMTRYIHAIVCLELESSTNGLIGVPEREELAAFAAFLEDFITDRTADGALQKGGLLQAG